MGYSIAGAFRPEAQFSLIIDRTQRFNAGDIGNATKVEAGEPVNGRSDHG